MNEYMLFKDYSIKNKNLNIYIRINDEKYFDDFFKNINNDIVSYEKYRKEFIKNINNNQWCGHMNNRSLIYGSILSDIDNLIDPMIRSEKINDILKKG